MRPTSVRGPVAPRLVAFLAAVLIASVLLAAVLPAPALAQQRTSSGASPGTISIGLRSAPPTPSNDPRAHRYIVDHLSAGASTTRRLEVGNHTDSPQRIEVYAGPATVQGGSFLPASPGESNALTRWIHLDRSVLHLQPGESAMVTATITVPAGAPDAEQYAVIWASHTSVAPDGNAAGTGTGSAGSAGSGSLGSSSTGSGGGETGIDQISRVGVRVYLSTGAGGAPGTGFEIVDLRPVWAAVGVAAFVATVTNTGHRAVDVAGTLDLTDGPGGLATPPLASEPATIAPGETAEIRFPVSEEIPIPAGDWTATVDLASGTEKQTTGRDLAVPAADAVSASGGSGGSTDATTAAVRPLGAGAALVGLVALLMLWFLIGRRRRGRSRG